MSPKTKAQRESNAQKIKQRRQLESTEDIRRHRHLRNAARQRASQQSLISQINSSAASNMATSLSSSSSSSSSSAAFRYFYFLFVSECSFCICMYACIFYMICVCIHVYSYIHFFLHIFMYSLKIG
jgi:hypothetical protein